VTVTVRHACPSRTVAERLAAALRADNPDFVHVAVDGPELTLRVTARSAGSARATLDDLLACLRVAERAVPPP